METVLGVILLSPPEGSWLIKHCFLPALLPETINKTRQSTLNAYELVICEVVDGLTV